MTIQFNYPWNGMDGIKTLSGAEETRLVGLGVARYYTPYMDGGPSNPEEITLKLTEAGLTLAGNSLTPSQAAQVRAGMGVASSTATQPFFGFGDSITADGGRVIDADGVVNVNVYQYSWHRYAELYSQGRAYWAGSVGLAGAFIGTLRSTYLPRLIQYAPAGSIVLVLMGQNNAGGTAQERADYTYCLETMLAAGLIPVVCLLTPGTSARTRHVMNSHYVSEAARLGLRVCDVGGAVTDPANGNWLADSHRDGTTGAHPNAVGARRMGIAAGATLAAMVTTPRADLYIPKHASGWGPNRTTENGGTTNPLFTGSSGGSPDVPTGWSAISGSYAGAFTYATTDFGRSCTMTGPASGELIVRNSSCNTALPGDKMLLVGYMTTVTPAWHIRMGISDTAGAVIYDAGRSSAQGSYIDVARSQLAIPFVHTGAATGLRIDFVIAGSTTTLTLEQFGLVNLTALGVA